MIDLLAVETKPAPAQRFDVYRRANRNFRKVHGLGDRLGSTFQLRRYRSFKRSVPFPPGHLTQVSGNKRQSEI